MVLFRKHGYLLILDLFVNILAMGKEEILIVVLNLVFDISHALLFNA